MLTRGTKIINDVFFSIFNLTDPIPLNIRGDLVLLLTGNATGVAADAFIDIDNNSHSTHFWLPTFLTSTLTSKYGAYPERGSHCLGTSPEFDT